MEKAQRFAAETDEKDNIVVDPLDDIDPNDYL